MPCKRSCRRPPLRRLLRRLRPAPADPAPGHQSRPIDPRTSSFHPGHGAAASHGARHSANQWRSWQALRRRSVVTGGARDRVRAICCPMSMSAGGGGGGGGSRGAGRRRTRDMWSIWLAAQVRAPPAPVRVSGRRRFTPARAAASHRDRSIGGGRRQTNPAVTPFT